MEHFTPFPRSFCDLRKASPLCLDSKQHVMRCSHLSHKAASVASKSVLKATKALNGCRARPMTCFTLSVVPAATT